MTGWTADSCARPSCGAPACWSSASHAPWSASGRDNRAALRLLERSASARLGQEEE